MERKAGNDTWSFSQSLIVALGEFVQQRREKRGLAATENFFIKTEDILSPSVGLNSDKAAPYADLPNQLTAHRLGKELRAYEVESRHDVTGKAGISIGGH